MAHTGITDSRTIVIDVEFHKSPAWKDYMTRNMYEDLYMNAEEFTRYLAAQQVETTRFLTEMGLAVKKEEKT